MAQPKLSCQSSLKELIKKKKKRTYKNESITTLVKHKISTLYLFSFNMFINTFLEEAELEGIIAPLDAFLMNTHLLFNLG